MSRTPLMAGNWKMNLNHLEALALVQKLAFSLTDDDFDALLVSGNSFAGTPAKAGFPSVTVPGGFVPATDPVINPFPSGVTFSGPAYSEPTLIGLAYAFEQATHYRVPPASTPPLPTDVVRRP